MKLSTQFSPDEDNASAILSLGYSALRQLLEAVCLSEGYAVYSHEAYTHFLFMKNQRRLALRFDRLRKLRNKAEYEGEKMLPSTTKNSLEEIRAIIVDLEDLLFS